MISALAYGVLSEAIGRKKTLLIGLAISIIGILIAITAKNIETLQLGRLIQGLGAGACSGLFRSIMRDVYEGEAMAKIAGLLGNLSVLSVILAPFIGGYLEHYFNWQASFYFILLYVILLFIAIVIGFQETSKHHHISRLHYRFIGRTYKELLKSRLFLGLSFSSLATYGGFFAWVTQSPILLVHEAGLSPVTYGYLMLITGAMIFLGNTINLRLLKRFHSLRILQWGWQIMALAGLWMLVGSHFFNSHTWFFVTLLPAMLAIFGSTFVWSNVVVNAFKPFGHIAGYAGGLYSTIQIFGGVVFSAIIAHINSSSQLPLGILMICSPVLAFIFFKWGMVVLSRHSRESGNP
jgi:DHA1 family bicyclomycin/chloramphenicol resistance-like MFS transporter/DHA1 family 2-module integral membrane pump EmrD-like MFS transporter